MLVFCILALVAQSYGQLVASNNCPSIQPALTQIQNSDILGDWYEWARIDQRYEHDHACVNIKYYLDENGEIIEQANSTIRVSGATYIWRGKLLPRAGEPEGVYDMIFNPYSRDTSLKGTLIDAKWGVWAIFHACGEENGNLVEFGWVWSKSKTLSQAYQQEVADALAKINLSLSSFTMVDFNNCPPRQDNVNPCKKCKKKPHH